MSLEDTHSLEENWKKNPDDPEALLRLAQAYAQGGNLGKAFLAYSKAIEKDWGEKAWIDFHVHFYAGALASREKIFLEIEDQARSDPSPEVRAYLACAYAKTGQLEKALVELDRAAREAGGRGPLPDFLRQAYRAVAAGLLIQRLEDRHEWVGRQAAQALADLGDKSGLPVLVKALKEKSWVSRESAALALAEFGHTAGFTALIDGLKDKDPEVRRDASKALMKVGDKSTGSALVEALKIGRAHV